MKRILSKINSAKWHAKVLRNITINLVTSKTECVAMLDPSIASDNMGDAIICEYGIRVLKELFPETSIVRVPTHQLPTKRDLKRLTKCRYKIVCGTNLISPHVESYSIWKFPQDLFGVADTITLAVGWGYYCPDISKASKTTYRYLLNSKVYHSVRDRYTEKKFREMGIQNVLFTACATLWEMTPEKCSVIPHQKADKVITTITDYCRSPEDDKMMLNILLEKYNDVYIWIQGKHDLEYLASIADVRRFHVIDQSVEQYQKVLKIGNVDYVGTRLHAGIYAMNYGIRSIIIAIDNRAKEMGKDVNLVMIDRADVAERLAEMIDLDFSTELDIPWENIQKWKAQFLKQAKVN